MDSKKRIGFMSYWGFGRGMCHTTLMWAKMLQDEYDIYILKHGHNKDEPYFNTVNVNITEADSYLVTPEVFKNWVEVNNLDAIVFDEYKQWTNEPDNFVQVAREMGCKVYGYLVMEKFQQSLAEQYDRIICTSMTMVRFMRAYKIRKHVYIPFSIDLTEFPDPKNVKKKPNEKFTFFHPGGFGGYKNRKNTEVVIKGFQKLRESNDNVKLIITSQKKYYVDGKLPDDIELINKNLSRQEIIDLFYQSDAVLLPSRWESVGVPILEALASGTPVVTTDAPPMNEFIRIGLNGFICKTSELLEMEDMTLFSAEVNADTLKNNMELIMNPTIYPMLARNSREVAERLYSLEKNKKYFLDFLKNEFR